MSWLVHLTWKQKAFNTQHIESRANDRAYKRRTVTSIAKAQRVALQLPPRRAAHNHFKKPTISRAEGGQLQAPVGPPPRLPTA